MPQFEVTEETLFIFAAQNYYNPLGVDAEEFEEDLKRFKYIKRLITRYIETDQLPERLILNHLIIIFNVFGIDAGLAILNLKIEKEYWHILKPFLIFLKIIRNDQYTAIPLDPGVVNALRKI